MTCQIKIHDMHLIDGETERSEATVLAEITGDAQSFLIAYDEKNEGMQNCRTEIKATGDELVEITRTGAYSSVMKIEKGRKNTCIYSTPVGELYMSFCGKSIGSSFNDGRLTKLEFSYDIESEGKLISKNKIRIVPEYKED